MFIKIEPPLLDEISGLHIVKSPGQKATKALKLKIKFLRSLATLDIINSHSEIPIFSSKEILEIFDSRILQN